MQDCFDWNTVDAKLIEQTLQPLYKSVVSRRLAVIEIYQTIAELLKSVLPINTVRCHRIRIQKNRLYIGGYYYAYLDKAGKKSITVLFQHHVDTAELCLTKKKIQRIIELITDTILHEIIHMRQYRKRKFKSTYLSESDKHQTVKQRYYSHPDEIDAHAFNAACELIRHHKQIDQTLEQIKSSNKKTKSNIFNQYMMIFDHDKTHPVIVDFIRRVKKYIPYAQLGKPYKRAPELRNS